MLHVGFSGEQKLRWNSECKSFLLESSPCDRNGRGRTEQRGDDKDLTMSQPAQQDVPEQIAHWRRPTLCVKDQALMPQLVAGITPRRSWPLLPLACPVTNQCLLWREPDSSLNAEVNPELATSWTLSGNRLPPRVSKVGPSSTTPCLPQIATCATHVYFMIFGNSSSQALVDLTWIEGG